MFRRNCALWEGIARRISSEGHCVDTDQVRVRIGTPSEDVAQYHGHFLDAKLVFPLTDEVYTLAGEKATALDT